MERLVRVTFTVLEFDPNEPPEEAESRVLEVWETDLGKYTGMKLLRSVRESGQVLQVLTSFRQCVEESVKWLR